jgi:hypothetical protein
MATDPEYRWHQEWIGFLQPEGLVVSPPALCAAQAHVNRNIAPVQQVLIDLVRIEKTSAGPDRRRVEQSVIPDMCEFCVKFLEWQPSDLTGTQGQAEIPESLQVGLAEYGETLKPNYAVPDPDNNGKWLLLIETVETGTDLDATEKREGRQWHASPQARFERLLRETEVPIGLLCNGTHLRVVYAPRGESSGSVTFPVQAMCEVAGRPIVAALHMLLSADRLFTVPTAQRLPAILRESRKYQNEVSTKLAEQVLAALNELLRGFQAANEATQGELLKDPLQKDPSHIYGGLLASLMRLVFILYAEDRGLLPLDPIFVNNYTVAGLFQRLREDNSRFPDTMDQRYGGWAQLLTLFRLIYDGGAHRSIRLPARQGKLFDPDAYPFLEGRPFGSTRQLEDFLKPPRVSDGVIYRLLSNLLLLDGERLSYRTLDVEQIGSVYEAMMGYELLVANGPSVGLRPDNVVVNLEELLQTAADNRQKLLRESAGCELTGQALEQLKLATRTEDFLTALSKKISGLTPYVVPGGGMFLQPTDERRRSGSDYTPRSLTEPIVRTTLRPVFERLGEHPRPQQILDLKICDPAMGSGAFLVEACRFLGDKLVDAWNHHRELPSIPPDEDPSLYARRLVAQRCLYGVDVNRFAVDLAKLSLWLATLAKDHPFTFLDHALRHGDSLVGFSRLQIGQFHWDTSRPHERVFGQDLLEKKIEQVTAFRREILEMAEDNVASILLKQQKLGLADEALFNVRRAGDLLVGAFLNASKDKERDNLRADYRDLFLSASRRNVSDLQKETAIADRLRSGKLPIVPFHWQIEFPEVFDRIQPGFDAFIGNPPFMGGKRISGTLGDSYGKWLTMSNPGTSGNVDLVAHFYRRVFGLLRDGGVFGLIATNTIAQGDTRRGGLAWLGTHGGEIVNAHRRVKWPGSAAVIVSVVVVTRGDTGTRRFIDGRPVDFISAFLSHRGTHDDPARLQSNQNRSFIGCDIKGQGFLFADGDRGATPIEVMEKLIAANPKNAMRIRPYIGGEELNSSPTQSPHRWVIHFGEMSEAEARHWPDLMRIVEQSVKPERATKSKELADWPWWRFWRVREELDKACAGLKKVLVVAQTSKSFGFVFLSTETVFSHKVVVFPFESYAAFAGLQCTCHQIWARFFGSTLKDDPVYTPSDCFETFPFPENWLTKPELESAGNSYYEFRAALMVRNNEGLTAIYNRFHSPDEREPDILKLRALHAAMDRAVLDAYGWSDIKTDGIFLLDFEEEEGGDSGQNRRSKPWRYRWPDDIRDEVLARLLELNRQRAQEEAVAGHAKATSERAKPPRGGARKGKKSEPLLPIPGQRIEDTQ